MTNFIPRVLRLSKKLEGSYVKGVRERDGGKGWGEDGERGKEGRGKEGRKEEVEEDQKEKQKKGRGTEWGWGTLYGSGTP